VPLSHESLLFNEMIFHAIVFGQFVSTLDKGADSVALVCLADDIDPDGGKYYQNCREAPSSKDSHDEQLAARLWTLSEEAVKQYL
jgi:hypothetical protein